MPPSLVKPHHVSELRPGDGLHDLSPQLLTRRSGQSRRTREVPQSTGPAITGHKQYRDQATGQREQEQRHAHGRSEPHPRRPAAEHVEHQADHRGPLPRISRQYVEYSTHGALRRSSGRSGPESRQTPAGAAV